ncbi:MAG: HAD family hydrolase, partial [Lawsonibacter sp.]|nr:HAD family hydrolase [Lawsonibacter sp.]
RLRQEVQQQLALEFPEVVSSISMPENLEINDVRATKGHAMLALCRVLSVDPQQAAAFGDGTNDLTMLQWSGTGVAMSNAAQEVRAVASLVAPKNVEDGVAQVLNRWFEA